MDFGQTLIYIVLLSCAVGIAAMCGLWLLKTCLEMLYALLYCVARVAHWMAWLLYFCRVRQEKPAPFVLDGPFLS